MKGYIILLNGNITFFGLIWLVVIFYSFPAYMRKTAGLFGFYALLSTININYPKVDVKSFFDKFRFFSFRRARLSSFAIPIIYISNRK